MRHIKLFEKFAQPYPAELKYLFNRFIDADRYYTDFILTSEEDDYLTDNDLDWEYQVHISFDDYTGRVFHNLVLELFNRLYSIGDFEFRICNALCATAKVAALKKGTNHSSNFYNISNVELSDIEDLLHKELKACQNIDRIDNNFFDTGLVLFFNDKFVDSI